MLRRMVGAVAIIVLTHRELRAQASVPGITFLIDSTILVADARGDSSTLRLWRAFASFTGRVAFAAGRGRLDVLTRRGGAPLVIDGAVSAEPLAGPGEYYLFDSTGFVLVHPATKTYARFPIADDAFNFERRRDHWPRGFRVEPSRVEAIPQRAKATAATVPIYIYWHADDVQRGAIAHGRLSIAGAPPGEINVARWFGAARAVARLADSTGRLSTAGTTLTAAIPRTKASVAPPSYMLKHEMTTLQRAAIDTSRFTIPRGFIEKPSRD